VEGTEPHQTKNNKSESDGEESGVRASPELPERHPEDDKCCESLDGNAQVRRGKHNVQNEVHNRREHRVNGPASRHPLESILAVGLKRLLMWGIPLSIAMFLVPAPGPDGSLLFYSLAHLMVLQIATFGFAIEITALTDEPWFTDTKRAWLASVASLVAAVVGFSALLTLATSAAARYDVSLQFLQLLSSLDIAWVVAALYIGARKLWSRNLGLLLGSVILAACVGSIALYLQTVGFTESGGWLIDGDALFRIVIPADTVAALLSLTILFAAFKSVQRTEQARPHS